MNFKLSWQEKYLKAGFHMIADDRKESCFRIIADNRKRLLHTFRSAEVSKLRARCAGGKIAANNMVDVEEEILRKQIYFFF